MASLQSWDEIVASTLTSNKTLREELGDVIHNVAPAETPILSSIKMAKVTSRYPQWLVDTYRAAATNAYIEDLEHTDHSKTVPTRAANIVQTVYRGGRITDVERYVEHAGMDDPLGYYEVKDIVEIKKDIELLLVKGSAITGDTDTACQANGLLNAISTNNTELSGATLTETIFNNILQLTWGNTARMPYQVYCNPKVKRSISGFTTNVTRNIDAAEMRQINTVSFYDSDFVQGMEIRMHRDLTDGDDTGQMVMIDPTYLASGWLNPLKSEMLARDGLRDRYQLSGHLTLLFNNEKAFAAATQIQYNVA
jgi:hypothetical protein